MSTLRLKSPLTHSSSSTTFVAEVMQSLLQQEVPAATFRARYQELFLDACHREFSVDATAFLARGLSLLTDNVVDENNQSVTSLVNHSQTAIQVMLIQGSAPARPFHLDIDDVKQWVEKKFAEPGVIDIARADAQPHSADLLFAIGAGAECAPTKPWIAAGGTVAAVMRPGAQRWADLIRFTRASAGALLVPIMDTSADLSQLTDDQLAALAGIDLLENLDAVTSFLRHAITLSSRKLIVAGLVYVGGAQHVIAQAAQDALMAFAEAHHPDTVLAWLGTPTDQTPVPLEVLEDAVQRYAARSLPTRIRDWCFNLFGQCGFPVIEILDAPLQSLGIVNCSSTMQGPNYIFAKRAQRWRAYASARQGKHVAYIVTPPARTHSVLDYKILHATYRGAPIFGLQPFDAELTRQLSASSLAFQVENPLEFDPLDPTAVHMRYAVHAGLWRLPYNPQSIWIAATVRGALALVLPKRI